MRLLNIGELRKDAIGALTFGAEIPPYKDGALPSAPALRHAFPTAPTWQVCACLGCSDVLCPGDLLPLCLGCVTPPLHCTRLACTPG